MLFGNAYVYKLLSGSCTKRRSKAHNGGRSCGNTYHTGIFFHLFEQIMGSDAGIIFFCIRSGLRYTLLNIERSTIVIAFFILLGRSIPFTFHRIDMNYNRMAAILHRRESIDQRFHIISFLDILIVKSHRFKEVTFTLPVTLTKRLQVFVQPAMIFGNRHLIVVDDDNHIAIKLRCIVQSFESFTAT